MSPQAISNRSTKDSVGRCLLHGKNREGCLARRKAIAVASNRLTATVINKIKKALTTAPRYAWPISRPMANCSRLEEMGSSSVGRYTHSPRPSRATTRLCCSAPVGLLRDEPATVPTAATVVTAVTVASDNVVGEGVVNCALHDRLYAKCVALLDSVNVSHGRSNLSAVMVSCNPVTDASLDVDGTIVSTRDSMSSSLVGIHATLVTDRTAADGVTTTALLDKFAASVNAVRLGVHSSTTSCNVGCCRKVRRLIWLSEENVLALLVSLAAWLRTSTPPTAHSRTSHEASQCVQAGAGVEFGAAVVVVGSGVGVGVIVVVVVVGADVVVVVVVGAGATVVVVVVGAFVVVVVGIAVVVVVVGAGVGAGVVVVMGGFVVVVVVVGAFVVVVVVGAFVVVVVGAFVVVVVVVGAFVVVVVSAFVVVVVGAGVGAGVVVGGI